MNRTARSLLLFMLLQLTVFGVSAQAERSQKLQHTLDSLLTAGNFPGISMAVVFADNTSIALTAGYNDREKNTLLRPADKMLQGSVGKTYFAAIAMQLIQQKKLALADKVSRYLGQYTWFSRIPNAEDITIKMLMNHTSGIMRYEFKDKFTRDLTAQPDKTWSPEELLSYVLDEKAPFKAGEGWDYSDTNYILLGMIIEKITGKKLYETVRQKLLQPLALRNTLPSDHRKLSGLAQGYAGEKNDFGGKDKVVQDDGNFLINPQFEWTGGGFYSTTEDLARWAKFLYEGKAFDASLLPLMLDAVPAKLGRDTKYGLGVILRPTATLGIIQGHSGFFPGYLTEMYYLPQQKMSIAVQVNTSDGKRMKIGALRCLIELAGIAIQ